tara:strand:+ start:3189 stop:3416 length:228 start_codon:yes stop_codon:yes gene_type:complete
MKAIINNKMTLNENIEDVQKQMQLLSNDKNISDKNRGELRKYYETKLKAYEDQRKTLIKNIDVKADVLDPRPKQD